MAVHAFTSFTYSYLGRARVLAATLRATHPDWVIWAVVTDRPPPGWAPDWPALGFDRTLTVEDLWGAGTPGWLFGHDIVEACTAVKGRALRALLAEPGCEAAVYFDPDIAVFNPLADVTDRLGRDSVVLTPHQVEPEDRAARLAIMDNEISSLRHGAYNLGFLAVTNDAEGRRFAAWWSDRLEEWCHDRTEAGLFVDQKWCDLAPCLFDRVGILRDPGYNVASWNLGHRPLAFDAEGTARVAGRPLRFYHFTKMGPVGDAMTSRYAGDNVEYYELWAWYRRAVAAATDPAIPGGWWHFGAYDDGEPVPKSARVLWRENLGLRATFPDPFRTGEGGFRDWLSAQGGATGPGP